jgi:ABC-2 type transport system ATP-binding protein
MTIPSHDADLLAAGIHVRAVEKRFRGVVALDEATLDVQPGEVVALLGRNGAGKSTLMRILGTTILPDAGAAYLDGHDVAREAPAARRSTGLVLSDERSWYWRLSGRENLEFFAILYGLTRPAARQRTTELLELLGLGPVAERRFDGYSSGMRARLSLARALVASPPVLLLDEPTRALDPVIAAELRGLTVDLAHDDRRAVLWVTHDIHEAATVADRLLFLAAGRIVADEPNHHDAAHVADLVAERLGEL